MRQECIEAVEDALKRKLKAGEADNIEKKIQEAKAYLWKTNREKMAKLSLSGQLSAAGEKAAKDIAADALKKKQRIAETILSRARNTQIYDSLPGSGLDRVKEFLVGNKTQNVEALSKVLLNRALAQLVDVSDPFLPKNLGFDQGNKKMESVVREMEGERTGLPDAAAYGNKLTVVLESLRQEFNSLGGNIGKIAGHFPHSHNPRLVFKMGDSNYVKFTSQFIKRAAYVNENGILYSDQQINEMLHDAWKSIAYDGQILDNPGQITGEGSRANAHSEHRELYFNNADDYLKYHQVLGGQSLHATVISHIHAMTRDIALLTIFGPNAKNEFKYLNENAYKDDAEMRIHPEIADKNKIRNSRIFDEVAGTRPAVNPGYIATSLQTLRALNLVSLGSSAITALTDLGSVILTSQLNHIPLMTTIREYYATLSSADARRQARRLGIAIDSLNSSIIRSGTDQLNYGFAQKFGGATVRLSGMPFITEVSQQSFSISLMDTAYHVVHSADNLDGIHKEDAQFMHTYDINDADIQLWKLANPEIWSDGKSKLLTDRAILEIPGVNPKFLRESADKYMSMIIHEQDFAVMMPGAEQQAFMHAGTVSGSVAGEFAASFWQFKSFALSLPWKHLVRTIEIGNDNKWSAAKYASAFFASSLIMGAIVVELKELVNGRDPLRITDKDFWVRAFLSSGGIGLLGDLVQSQTSQFNNSPVESLAGPTISKLGQAVELTLGNAIKKSKEEETYFGAEALRLVSSANPLSTLWFTKAAFNHLVTQQLQEALSPGYLRRMKQRSEREFKQSFYWEPGDAAPSRLPKFSRAFEKK